MTRYFSGVCSVALVVSAVGCSARPDVLIIDIASETLVGKLSPPVFSPYFQVVVGKDEERGRIAVVAPGARESTLRIATFDPWDVEEYSIDAGKYIVKDRKSALGRGSFDARKDRFWYWCRDAEGHGMTVALGLDGSMEEYHLGASCEVTPEGLFLLRLDHHYSESVKGFTVTRLASMTGVEEMVGHFDKVHLFWSPATWGGTLCLIVSEDNHWNRNVMSLVLIDRQTLTHRTVSLPWKGGMLAVKDGYALHLECDDVYPKILGAARVRRFPVEDPGKAQIFEVSPSLGIEDGRGVGAIALTRDYGVLLLFDDDRVPLTGEPSRGMKLIVIEFATGKMKVVILRDLVKRVTGGDSTMGAIFYHMEGMDHGGRNLMIFSS